MRFRFNLSVAMRLLVTCSPVLAIVLVSLGLYVQMLFYPGYISWGNFGTPLFLTFEHSFLPSGVTWAFYSSYGIPVTSPMVGLADSVYDPILLLLGGAWNSEFAMKLFIVLSTVFFAASFYRLTSTFSQSKLSRTVATLFMLLNPVTINFVQQGLFTSYLWQGFFFLGLSFVPAALKHEGLGKVKYAFLSALCIALTIGQPELFYLGVPLYFVFVAYFAIIHTSDYSRKSFVNFAKTSLTTCGLLIGLLMPLILTTAFSAYNLSPTSSLANPLSDYIAYSPNVWNLLSMDANPAFPLAQFISGPWSLVWLGSLATVSLLLLSSGFLFRDDRLLFLATIAVLAALFGAGSVSPIAALNNQLYEHFPGYQVLNDGYFWAWIVIVPIYGLIVCAIGDRLQELGKPDATEEPRTVSPAARTPRRLRNVRARFSKAAVFVISVVLSIALLTPLASQAYYGSDGIHPNELPGDYSSLITQLSDLVGSTGYGVALFPPDSGVVLGNSSGGSINPMWLDPWVRTATPITYGAVSTPSGYYFHWVYQEFYSNQTEELAQLMGVMGVKYFVTLNHVNGQNESYTEEMSYQRNITLIYSCPAYSIFESTLPVDVATSVKGIVLLSNSYTAIQVAAADGLDVSKVPLAFTGDLDEQNFEFFLNHTIGLFLHDPKDLISIAVARYANVSNTVVPYDAVSNVAYSITSGWVRDTVLYVWPETIPNSAIESASSPFVLTESGAPLSATTSLPGPGNYTLWADLFDSPVAGSQLTLSIGEETSSIPTSTIGSPGGFTWVGVPFNASGDQVRISAEGSGLNGISEFVLLRTGLVGDELSTLHSLMTIQRLEVVYYGNASNSTSLQSSIGSINNSTIGEEPLNISSAPNSYQLSGRFQNVSLVRLNYFEGVTPIGPSTTEIPVLGGMSFLVITSNQTTSLVFQSVEYVPLLWGTAVFGITLCIGALVWWREIPRLRRGRTLRGRRSGVDSDAAASARTWPEHSGK